MRFLCRAAPGRLVFLCAAVDHCYATQPLSSGEVIVVLDVLYLALGLGGFAVCLAYLFLCDRL
jgi:hypothetical protein